MTGRVKYAVSEGVFVLLVTKEVKPIFISGLKDVHDYNLTVHGTNHNQIIERERQRILKTERQS